MGRGKQNRVKTEAETIFTPIDSKEPAKTAEEMKKLAEVNESEVTEKQVATPVIEQPKPHKPAIGEIISRPEKPKPQPKPVVEVQETPDKGTVSDRPLLFTTDEYDTTKPEDTFREFIRNVKAMVKRYDANITRLSELEDQMQDVMHFMEMSKSKNVPEGYKLYKKLTDIRKERRACKNEMDLLKPVYEMFHGTKLLDQLAHVQGECGKVKKSIDGRAYTVRTYILEDLIK